MTRQVIRLAARTKGAFSFSNYGLQRWRAAIRMLLRRGYDEREIEAIMRSKWTRWAGDHASGRKGWRYGRTNSADLARFLDGYPKGSLAYDVAMLVATTYQTRG